MVEMARDENGVRQKKICKNSELRKYIVTKKKYNRKWYAIKLSTIIHFSHLLVTFLAIMTADYELQL